MRSVDIFVGSSIIELEEERNAFADIVNELNVKLKAKELIFYLRRCEYSTGYIEDVPSQDIIDEQVIGSDYSYFIVRTKFGEWTKHEYETAYKRFLEFGAPRISVMFRKLGTNEVLSEEALAFQAELVRIKYYYKAYQNKEELKLNVILNLIVDNILSSHEVKAEDDGLYIGDIKLIDTNQIPYYNRHIELEKLQKELDRLETLEGTCDDKRQRRLLREKIQKINYRIHEIETLIYQTMLNLTKAARGNITPLLRRAIHFIENGDVEKAAEILNRTAVENEMDSYVENTEISLDGVKAAIETAVVAIETMQQLPETILRSLEIEELYKKIVSLEIKYKLNRYHCGLYVRYLLNHKKTDDAIEYSWIYLESVDDRIETVEDFAKADYALFGMRLFWEPYYKKDPERFQRLYVDTCYQYIKLYEKALKMFDNDININIYMLGIVCDDLMDVLNSWSTSKDEEILNIERDLKGTVEWLNKAGYHKVNISDLDAEKDAKRMNDRFELKRTIEKLNDEPETNDPVEYMTEYLKIVEEILQFCNTSNNMFTVNNPIIEQMNQEYEMVKRSLENHDIDSIQWLYIQCKLNHAKHFMNVYNFDIANQDFEAAYTLLLKRENLDELESLFLCDTCFGFSNSLIAKANTQKAVSVSLEGIARCEKLVEVNEKCRSFLAKLYANHALVIMKARAHNCIINGLHYSEKALTYYKSHKDTLNSQEGIDAIKAYYVYAMILNENGENEDALQNTLEAVDCLELVDEATQIKEQMLIKGLLQEAIITAVKAEKFDQTIAALSERFSPEMIEKLVKEIGADDIPN